MSFRRQTVARKDLVQLDDDMKRDIKFEKYLFKKYTSNGYGYAEIKFKTGQSFAISSSEKNKKWFREMFCIGLSDCIRREIKILNRKKRNR